jgi:Fibronectin type III domain/Chitobiase/beta-hexosaminidase C-terminal domain
MGTAGAIVASAATPEFPNNLVVFPDRDFLSVEGYQDRVGQTALIEVTRGGEVVGSAKATVAEGDPALEINHPGGACWGAGTDLKVTPDIRAGDKVSIKFGEDVVDDTIVQDAAVDTDTTINETTRTVTVKGYIAAGVNPGQVEQRIVNPDLVDLIGKRDVRALPGALTPSDKGGYSSGLDISNGRFVATYVFDTLEAARTAAAGGGERFMAWQAEDADANRQGLTIAEYGEAGGPGMGGCPAGPADAAPPQGTYSAVRSDDGASIVVNWTAAKAAPGATPVTGYSVEAIEPGDGSAPRPGVVMRTNATTTRVTLPVKAAVADYEVEVRSLAGTKMSEAFPPANTGSGTADTVAPKVTASPAPVDGTAVRASLVTLTSDDQAADIFYTTDGSPARAPGDVPSATAKLYTGPITIGRATPTTELNWVAFDRAGLSSGNEKGLYEPEPAPAPPPAPSNLKATPAERSVALSWDPADRATGYQVTVSKGGTKLAEQPAPVTGTSQTIQGLTADTEYTVTVTAKNDGGSNESTPLTVKTLAATERVTITTAKWKSNDFRVVGTSSATSGTVSVYRAVTDATNKVVPADTPIAGMANQPLTPAVAPETGSTFDVRLRTNVPNPKPAQIFVKSSNGGIAGPFNVANG